MGCDITILSMSISVPCFNPRTHMGCDLPCHKYQGATTVSIHAPTWGATTVVMHRPEQNCEFQSTHPHGVRPTSSHSIGWSLGMFQSTHPHGVRLIQQLLILQKQWFQSTHPHGVRLLNYDREAIYSGVSIHAPTWGATYISRMALR